MAEPMLPMRSIVDLSIYATWLSCSVPSWSLVLLPLLVGFWKL